MKKTTFFFALLFLSSILFAQKADWKKINSFRPDAIFMKGERKPAKVLLLGTFHFGYPNLDGHKTDSSKYINVLSPQRQKEMEELATVIRRFKPTRIYVESSDQPWIDSLYQEYRAGHYKLGRNEIFQLGFRIAGQMNHTQVYAVDTWPFSSEYNTTYTWIDSLWESGQPVDSVRDKYWSEKYKQFYNAGDSVEVQLTMLENFLLMAEPAILRRMHGHYLTAGFNTAPDANGDKGQQGPDRLSVWWYNRNLRIFNNILRTRLSGNDRIVVLFGNGHAPILKHCFYSSPEFELVELKTLLR
jgi:Family of unknown function (DUF5694)